MAAGQASSSTGYTERMTYHTKEHLGYSKEHLKLQRESYGQVHRLHSVVLLLDPTLLDEEQCEQSQSLYLLARISPHVALAMRALVYCTVAQGQIDLPSSLDDVVQSTVVW